jgi:EmrB/QacA subfamily drug resistance transporter
MTEKHEFARGFALLVAATSFMELLDGTIIQTALTQIGSDLGVSVSASALAMSAYFAAVAAVIPLTAWMADKYGVRNSFVLGISVFTVASLFCGNSTSFAELLIFRILQGAGGAVMINVGQLSILRSTAKSNLLRATAYLIWPALAAPVLAPPIGGIITDLAGWRWLFFINVPLGIVAAILAFRMAPRQDEVALGLIPKLDRVGATLLAVGLFVLIPSLSLVGLGNAPARILAIAIGLACCVGATLWLFRAANPLLDLRLYGIRTFRVGNASGALYRAVVATAPLLLTLMLQTSFGWSAAYAGLMVMWLFVGNISIKPMANFLVRRYGFKWVIVWATFGGAATLAISAFLTKDTDPIAIGLLLLVSGAARSVAFTAYASLQYSDVPPARMSSANPLSGVVQQIAVSLGIAVFVGGLSILNSARQPELAFRTVLILMALSLATSAFGALRLPVAAGNQAS